MTFSALVTASAQAQILQMAQTSRDGLETGGLLLGVGPSEDGTIEVDQAGDPGPNATRQLSFFSRDLSHARALAARAWTDRKAIWVGEWHTHPHGPSSASNTDLQTYARLLGTTDLGFVAFVSVIVTPSTTEAWDKPEMTTWIFWSARRGALNVLQARNYVREDGND